MNVKTLPADHCWADCLRVRRVFSYETMRTYLGIGEKMLSPARNFLMVPPALNQLCRFSCWALRNSLLRCFHCCDVNVLRILETPKQASACISTLCCYSFCSVNQNNSIIKTAVMKNLYEKYCSSSRCWLASVPVHTTTGQFGVSKLL